jgi:hypothetical protein
MAADLAWIQQSCSYRFESPPDYSNVGEVLMMHLPALQEVLEFLARWMNWKVGKEAGDFECLRMMS